MPGPTSRIIAGLALLAGTTAMVGAADSGGGQDAGVGAGSGAGAMPAGAGGGANMPAPAMATAGPGTTQILGQQAQRQVFLQGLVDLSFFDQNNYRDGNNNVNDRTTGGLLRAELGAKIDLDESVETQTTVSYQGLAGGGAYVPNLPQTTQSTVQLNDAYVLFRDLFDYDKLSLKVGRQEESWNLRNNHGAFLYDSRANYPAVDGWDGALAHLHVDDYLFSPFVYKLPDQSRLLGIQADWQPFNDSQGALLNPNQGNNLFLTGSISLEQHLRLPVGIGDRLALAPVVGDTATEVIADKLWSFYGGTDFYTDKGLEIYGEGAFQHGTVNSSQSLGGYGFDVGMEYHADTQNPMSFGVEFDHLSGSDQSTTGTDRAFINNWCGESDTYIVENAEYGALSRYTQDRFGLQSVKAKAQFALDQSAHHLITLVYGFYRLPNPPDGSSRDLGQEGDLTYTWKYTNNATFSLFGALFQPESGYLTVAPDQANAGRDLIYLLGTSVRVAF